jgi:hypothetical protein
MLTRYTVMQAVARGWCHPSNAGKEMDVDLTQAITDEIMKASVNSTSTSVPGSDTDSICPSTIPFTF